jgi:hypothetical protein
MTDLQSGLRNGLENAGKLGRQLYDLNNDTLVKFVELSTENFKKYLELNQNYVAKLPEINDVSSFVELQREYGQNLWEGVQADLRARGEIVREAVEQTGSLVRGTFSEEAGAESAPIVEAA